MGRVVTFSLGGCVLNSEELLYLAIDAAKNGNHHTALTYLHSCLDMDSENANARFMLGAEYAELRLYARAIEQLEHSLQINPDLELAEVQLSLLYIVQGRSDKADKLLSKLSVNASGPATREFAEILMLLNSGELESTKSKLGILLGKEFDDPPLRQIVQNVLNSLLLQGRPPNPAKRSDKEISAESSGFQPAFELYRNTFGDEE